MSERFSLDRASFEQVLSASSLIQQFNHRLLMGQAPPQDDAEILSDLVEIQSAIETETLNLEAAMQRIVRVALQLHRVAGAAIGLLQETGFVFRAAAGYSVDEEKLKAEVLARLATVAPSAGSTALSASTSHWNVAREATHYPGSVKSLLVTPIYERRKIAGALAVFSTEFDAFAENDHTKARLLSGLLTQALGKNAEVELRRTVSTERAALLEAIDQLIPALAELADKNKQDLPHPSRELPSTANILVTINQSLVVDNSNPIGLRILESTKSSSVSPLQESVQPEPDSFTVSRLSVEPVVDVAPAETMPFTSRARPAPSDARPSALVSSAVGERLEPVVAQVDRWIFRTSEQLGGASSVIRRSITKTRHLLLVTAANARAAIRGAAVYSVRVRIPAAEKSHFRGLSRTLGPATIISSMIVFSFFLVSGTGRSPDVVAVAEANATRSTEATVVPANVSVHKSRKALSQPSSASLQVDDPGSPVGQTHRQVTDPVLSDALRSLSRYEIAGLRRQATFGDGSAALLLGMAYETGRFVPQNCTKAAEWVKQSARAGNRAAEYNLGLRYSTGDGVPVDQDAASKWLKLAAAHRYSQALVAVNAMP